MYNFKIIQNVRPYTILLFGVIALGLSPLGQVKIVSLLSFFLEKTGLI